MLQRSQILASGKAPVQHSRPAAHDRSRRATVSVSCTATLEPSTDAATDKSGLRYLPEAAKTKATDRKANKFEKTKVEKCGSTAWTEVYELAALIREGKSTWEELNLDDVDVRLKWAGLFHRRKQTPGRFMMRVKLPNGELNAEQLRFLGDCIAPYGENGCADITTRASIQLRGLVLEDADKVIDGLRARGMHSFCSGMDNVRNLTGNPIAGVDPHELIDTRPLLNAMNAMITGNGEGRVELGNMPRKLNICISSTRDDFPHTHINDVGFEAVQHPESGEVVFNVVIGGYFSIKRNIVSLPLDCSVTQEQLLPFVDALLRVFRDHGPRGDRQKTRLIWLAEELGFPAFKDLIQQYMGEGAVLAGAVHAAHEGEWKRRDIIGVHPQKQEGFSFVGACVPAGRLQASDFQEVARIADAYGDGSVRLTCEENIIFVNVPNDKVEAMLAEPLFQRLPVNAGPLMRGMVSCTGSQFCGFAMSETKNKAIEVVKQLEEQLDIPQTVRMHFTGCPNSCGQAQVGDIGLMGAPAKVDGKAQEGFKLFLGGKIGENPELAKEFGQGVPAATEHLVPRLAEVLVAEFGAKPKAVAA